MASLNNSSQSWRQREGAVECTAKLKTNETLISESWHGDVSSSQRYANTHTHTCRNFQVRRREGMRKQWGETIQKIKANVLSECKLIVLFSPQPRSHLLFYVTLPPSLLLQQAEGWQIRSEVHFATWRPTVSVVQPIRGCEKQPPAPQLVHCFRETIPLSMAVSLCRLAVLKPIILPPFFVQTSFLQHNPFTHIRAQTDRHTHTHTCKSPPTPQNVTTRA